MCDRIRSMLRRRLVLLLVVYASLDFANPLMPGAVTFEGGSMDAATVECHRPVASAPLAALPSVQVPTIVPTLPSPASPVRISGAVRRPIPTARRLAPPLEPASPAEDH
jgi:hypothetical protein